MAPPEVEVVYDDRNGVAARAAGVADVALGYTKAWKGVYWLDPSACTTAELLRPLTIWPWVQRSWPWWPVIPDGPSRRF